MKRHLYFILFIGFMLLGIRGFGQTIQVSANFNAGNYGKGSSITVPISTAGVFDINQKFEIWLSDAAGSFAAAQKIGEFQGFFTTFVNGTIPVGTPTGANYRIQVRATTAGVTPVTTPAFAINSNQAVVAKITSASLTELRVNEILGRCSAGTAGVVLEAKSTPFADSTSIVG
jgi:large repetitive protein